MLIDVLAGRDRRSAKSWGSYHFACVPKVGDKLEIDGTALTVTDAWHRPDIYYKGAKFVILASEAVGRSASQLEVRDDAGAVV